MSTPFKLKAGHEHYPDGLFRHVQLPDPAYKVIDRIDDFGPYRLYKVLNCSTGKTALMPSATATLGGGPKKILSDWQERMGPDRAEFIFKMAGYQGNTLHRSQEWAFFNHLTPTELKKHIFFPLMAEIQFIIGCELQVVDADHGIAGTFDLCYLDWDGKVRLADTKTHHRAYPLYVTKYNVVAEQDDDTHLLDRTVQDHKMTKWRKQHTIYKHGLLNTFGVEVDICETWLLNTVTYTAERIITMDSPIAFNRSEKAVRGGLQKFYKNFGIKV